MGQGADVDRSVVISTRVPESVRDRLASEAQAHGMNLSRWVLARLSAPMMKPGSAPSKEPAGVTPEATEANDERNTRHLSPVVEPHLTEIRSGYTVAETDCTHPKDQRQEFSYMTKCKACGRRIR